MNIYCCKNGISSEVKLTYENDTEFGIYRASSKNGKYKKIKSTESTRYSSKKLKAGTKYYYKVRAYKVVDESRVYGRK